tara:strand:+ start:1594 stop:2097 length:504 start_codon:yes stop_codon:yes gene_type:complete
MEFGNNPFGSGYSAAAKEVFGQGLAHDSSVFGDEFNLKAPLVSGGDISHLTSPGWMDYLAAGLAGYGATQAKQQQPPYQSMVPPQSMAVQPQAPVRRNILPTVDADNLMAAAAARQLAAAPTADDEGGGLLSGLLGVAGGIGGMMLGGPQGAAIGGKLGGLAGDLVG